MALTPAQLAQVVKLAWKQGRLDYKLKNWQREAKLRWEQSPKDLFVLHCSRQIGKSVMLLTLATEACLKKPGTRIGFVSHVERRLEDFIRPIFHLVFKDCPSEL